jgi:Flp pilus assembly protein TadD
MTSLYCVSSSWRNRLLAALISAVIAMPACSTWPPEHQNETPTSSCERGLNPTDNTRLAGIEQLVGDGKYYAALAQLDALGGTSPQSELVRADALRRIDRDSEANAIYLKLAGGCLDGRAQHGLGLVAAKSGRTLESVEFFQRARLALPTDIRVRNDLGYAMLLVNQVDAAQFEFLTVLDLNPGDSKAGRNLVLLTFLRGQPDKARELARKMALDEVTALQLQRQADAMRQNPAFPNTHTPPDKNSP